MLQSGARAQGWAVRRALKLGACAAVAGALTLGASGAHAQQPPQVIAQDQPPPPPQPAQPPAHIVIDAQPSNGPRLITDWNEGEPIPAGYHPVTRPRKGLVAGGAALFGSFYLISALVAAVDEDDANAHNRSNPAWALYIPGLGPFIQMGHGGNGATENFFLLLDGVAQVGGAVMFVLGVTQPKTVLVRDDLGKVRITPTPYVARGGGGLGLVGTF